MITNPHALAVWVEIELDATGQKTILMVKTDLELDQQEPDYEPAEVAALIADLRGHQSALKYFDTVKIVRSW